MPNTTRADTLAYLRRAIEYAPAEAPQVAPDLLGWRTTDGLFVCARCAGRIFARGCALPPGAVAIWIDQADGTERCDLEGETEVQRRSSHDWQRLNGERE